MGIIQANAIRSWLAFCPPCEILLMGRDEGTAEIAHELRIRHIPDIECNEFGTPLIKSLFETAERAAQCGLLCQINADIMITDDFLPSVQKVATRMRRFLLAGQRWNVDVEKSWNFTQPDWGPRLRDHARHKGVLEPPTGLDYFVFPSGLWTDLPPFAIGRRILDNWLIYRARVLRVPVVDATNAITAIHQNHDYSFHPKGERGVMEGPEVERNLQLAGGWQFVFTLRDATHILSPAGLKRALTREHAKRRLRTFPILNPDLWRCMSPAVGVIRFIKRAWR